MISTAVPPYSVAPLVGMVVHGLLSLLCLVVFTTYRRYQPLKSLFFFYFFLFGFFLGFTVYGFQDSEQSILQGYRLMLLSLCGAPLAWIWFAHHLQGVRPGRWVWLILASSATMAILLFIDHPATLGLPLVYKPLPGVWQPSSHWLKPIIYAFDLTIVLVTVIFFFLRLWKAPGKPAYMRAIVAGLAIWFLGGLHDAAYSLEIAFTLNQHIMWLGSVWFSLCLAVAIAIHLRTLEGSLRQSEEKLAKTLWLSPVWISLTDRQDGSLLEVNDSFLRISGFARAEVLGRSELELGIWPDPAPRAEGLAMVEQQGRVREQEVRLRMKDGQERSFLWSVEPLQIEERQCLIHVMADVTERRRAEDTLRTSEEKFSKLFHNSPVWITLSTMAEGRYLDVNEAYLRGTGWDRQEVVGHTSRELGLWVDEDQRRQGLRILEKLGSIREMLVDFRRKSGEKIICSWSAERIEIAGVPCLVSVVSDITEQKSAERDKARLEAQLLQAQKMEAIGTLAGGIAHDFNNILAAVLGFAEIAHEDAKKGKVNQEDIEEIIASAQRAKELVQQILAFSRKQDLDLKPLSLNQLVQRTKAILDRTLPKMISIVPILAEGLPPVLADATRLEQVLLNLASNAQDAMPEGGQLTIETRQVELDHEYCRRHLDIQPGAYALLTVTDTGVGMDEATRAHIFEPFYTTKEIGKGTGLGLSSAYGIVKDHGGHILCASQPGQGTVFSIYLPAYQTESVRPEVAASEQDGDALAGGETILLVDDEDSLRMFAQRMLAGKGYRVLAARNGEEALELYRRRGQEVDLVLMDLGMPGMGGLKALKAILEMDPKTKVVIASGYAADDQVKKALEAGAVGYVAKPFRRVDLLTTARRALDNG